MALMKPKFATASDAVEIGQLLHNFNTEFDVPTPGSAQLGQRLSLLLAGKSMFAIVAGEPVIAVALVSVRPNIWGKGKIGLLEELYVTPKWRSQGVGTAILRSLHHHATSNGFDNIEINVDEGDTKARKFYERNGYTSSEPNTDERALYYYREI